MTMVKRAIATLVLGAILVGCGRSSPTATPPPPTATTVPTAVPTTAPTATRVATPIANIQPTLGATPGGTPRAATPAAATPGATTAANPAAVATAYANLAKLDSYHLEIVVTDIGNLLQFGLGNKLTYSIDSNKGDQRISVDDGSGIKQEGYKVGGKAYTVENGKASEVASLPLIYTLPDLLYNTLTVPGAMTFTATGSEQVNDRSSTKYSGTGTLARLSSNPLLALALAGASGDIAGSIWIDTRESFLVAGDLTVTLAAPRTGTTKLRMDVTKVNQIAPISVPK